MTIVCQLKRLLGLLLLITKAVFMFLLLFLGTDLLDDTSEHWGESFLFELKDAIIADVLLIVLN